MKTIEHKGKVYQAGAVYEFSDDGKTWYADVLEDVRSDSDLFTYKARLNSYDLIRACQAKVGTITEAPAELVDGECYQFTAHLGNECKGFFLAEYGRLYCTTGVIIDPSKCSNIKLLVVGE